MMILYVFHLYQDNSARCWILEKNQLEEVPVYTNFPELKESTDVKLKLDLFDLPLFNDCVSLYLSDRHL
jgi:hypothetical protein